MESASGVNQALVSQSTHAMMCRAIDYQPVDNLNLKGFPDVTRAWRPVAMRPAESRFQRDRDSSSPLIGRVDEVAQLQAAWALARKGDGSAILIEGEPGVGKSRIVSELANHLGECHTILLQCQPRTQGEALSSIIRMYDRAHEEAEDPALANAAVRTAERIGTLEDDISLGPETRRAAIVTAVADGFLGLAEAQPLLMLAEDLHWADEVTLAVLRRLGRDVGGRSILILATSRPEANLNGELEAFSDLSLAPVGAKEAHALIEAAAPGALTRATCDWIVEKVDGNPLFLLELTAYASDPEAANGHLTDISGANVMSLRDLLGICRASKAHGAGGQRAGSGIPLSPAVTAESALHHAGVGRRPSAVDRPWFAGGDKQRLQLYVPPPLDAGCGL
ncbi:AAA family ATPase [Ruegeria sp. HKCCD8929]|uniref:AAA family ATPase n=1 Tax=Ruegeria sp. HKCCD8929 TaxID=2683006 RepID=UPI00148A0CBC|nr:AAA family ATPase [Ruegeria sp. HKCCD8929]